MDQYPYEQYPPVPQQGQPVPPPGYPQPMYGGNPYPGQPVQPYGAPQQAAPPFYGQPAAHYGAPTPGQQTAPPFYGAAQPVQPMYYPAPVPYVPVYSAPQFALKPTEDPRRVGARKTTNRMCLVVLLQTAAALLLEIPLVALLWNCGIDIYSNEAAFQWLSTAMVPLSTALPFFVYLIWKHESAAEYLRFEKAGFFTGLLCVLAGLGVCLLGNLPAVLIQDAFGAFGYEPASAISGGEQSWYLFGLELFSTAILVPVMEEFAFRGVLFSALRKYGAGFAVFASALVFGLVHLDFSNVVFAFIAGLVFGFLYERTRNLWVTIFIHALNNGFAVVMGDYGSFLFGQDTVDFLGDIVMYLLIGIGLVALLILLLWKRKKLFGKREPEPQMPAPLSVGESLGAVVRAPLFWVIFCMMAAYTTTLFF